MLLIVAHHFVVNSGVMDIMNQQVKVPHSMALYLEGMWGKTAINCFVLITGWFMCKSHITARKFFKLLLEVVFYCLVINAVFWATGYHEYSVGEYLMCLWPFWDMTHNFVSCYLVFFLFIPFLNILVNNMTRKQHLMLVILCLTVYSILEMLPKIEVSYSYIGWFCILYIISSYLRLHLTFHRNDLGFWAKAAIASVLLSIISVVILAPKGHAYSLVSTNRILAVLTGITSFMLFVNIKIPYNRFINTVAASTFGVLLIHANSDVMRQWLWKDVCDVSGHYYSPYFWIYIIAVPVIVFSACIVIDHFRLRYLERPVVDGVTALYEKCKGKLLKSGLLQLRIEQ